LLGVFHVNLRKSRFVGCILGKAVGDAVGAPVEFKGPKESQQYIEDHIRPLKFEGVVREYEGPWPFGQYTDDTQLARELVLSLIDCGGCFNPYNYAQRLVEIHTAGKMVGSGKATAQAFEKLAAGELWMKSGTPHPAAGNGSAMRAAPLGLTYVDRWERDFLSLLVDADNQSRITHTDPRSVAGSVAMSGAIALLVSGVDPQHKAFTGTLSEWVGAYDSVLAEGILSLRKISERSPKKAYKKLRRVGLAKTFKSMWDPGISPFVTTGVLWALYSFLHTPEDFTETLCTSIWPGGDVDTTAAMAGALSGTWGGLEGIPSEMIQPLTDQGAWRAPDLIELALSLEELC
jgi:ADP-ribosylglycohydrolase